MTDSPHARRASDTGDGPSLETYVETRFNLLIESIHGQMEQQKDACRMIVDSSKVASVALKAASEAAQVATDLRYQQRFEAQSDALAAAFQSQQQAMQTAFTVAEKAVQAALAAADRAVCVSADTPVLCADLVWRPAGDLRAGDALVAFEENHQGAKSQGRRYQKAYVTANAGASMTSCGSRRTTDRSAATASIRG